MESASMQEKQYIKPNNETYKIRTTESVDPVRRISLWLLLPFILLLILGGYFLFASFSMQITGQATYTVDGEIDYQVFLKENDYYNSAYLSSGQQYIASLINTIKTEFNYELTVDGDAAVDYNYEILATAIATDKSDKTKVLYEKTDVLKSSTAQILTTGKAAIYELVEVDYNIYNDLMRSFRQDFGISANCFLNLQLIVNLSGAIEAEDALSLSIPLTDQTVDITMDAKSINRTETVGDAVTEIYVQNWPLLITASAMIALSVLASMIILALYLTRYGNNWYEEAKSTILRNYDSRIVTIENTFFEPEATIRVNSFTELLDAADNEGSPILFCEVIPGEKAYFIVNGANNTYRYTLTQAYQQELRRTKRGKEF